MCFIYLLSVINRKFETNSTMTFPTGSQAHYIFDALEAQIKSIFVSNVGVIVFINLKLIKSQSSAHYNKGEHVWSGIAGTGTVVVRAEEALIVIIVLVLWVGAIVLFFNRWGKIRMLEPYQPKFQQQHRQSCAIVDPNPLQVNTYSLIFAFHSPSPWAFP